MKFLMNGGLITGTMDDANIQIRTLEYGRITVPPYPPNAAHI